MVDDDIIELTDIIQKGHATAQAAASAAVQGGTPAAEAQMPDFGADLDELLQNYDKPASTAPAAAQVTAAPAPAAVDQAVAAPIANQESTDHKVDPNEELDLPPLSDLDALLEELGVQDKATAVDTPEAALVGDELDAMPSSELAAAVAAPAPAMAPASAIAAEEPAGDEGIDLNELDALLDSVLASAPKPAAAAVPAPEPAARVELPTPEPEVAPKAQAAPEPAAPAQASLSPDDTAVADLRAEVASLRAELDDLRVNIDKYAAAAAAKVIREELAAIAASLE